MSEEYGEAYISMDPLRRERSHIVWRDAVVHFGASNGAIVWRRESDNRLVLGNYLVLSEIEETTFREFFAKEVS